MSYFPMLESEISRATTVPLSELERLKDVLDEHGFAVVADVLQDAECAEAEQRFADDLRSIITTTNGSNDDETATTLRLIQEDPLRNWPLSSMPLGRVLPAFATDFGLPHGRMAWYCRLRPNVRLVFQAIFGRDEQLCVGVDNPFFNNRPPTPTDDDSKRRCSLWPHVDQSSHIQPSGQWPSFQGLLYLRGATSETSSTVVWPGSHRTLYQELMTSRAFGSHYCELPLVMAAAFTAHARRVPVPRGAMLIWNSRTAHQGWTNGPRLAMPICFEPCSRRTAKALGHKLGLVRRGVPSTHWASLGIAHDCYIPGGAEYVGVSIQPAAHKWLLERGQQEEVEGEKGDDDDDDGMLDDGPRIPKEMMALL